MYAVQVNIVGSSNRKRNLLLDRKLLFIERPFCFQKLISVPMQ